LSIFLLPGCSSSSPQNSLVAVFLSANAGNYTEANAGVSDQLRQMLNQGGVMQVIWDQVTKKGTIKNIDITKSEIRGEGATIYYKINYKDGTNVEADEIMTKENGAWRIGSVKFMGIHRAKDKGGPVPVPDFGKD
jgi:hypothetical protein